MRRRHHDRFKIYPLYGQPRLASAQLRDHQIVRRLLLPARAQNGRRRAHQYDRDLRLRQAFGHRPAQRKGAANAQDLDAVHPQTRGQMERYSHRLRLDRAGHGRRHADLDAPCRREHRYARQDVHSAFPAGIQGHRARRRGGRFDLYARPAEFRFSAPRAEDHPDDRRPV